MNILRHVISSTGARRRSASPYLLSWTIGNFTRSSEAAFYDPRFKSFASTDPALSWKLPNEPRIFSDGAILIEGTRKNAVQWSKDMTQKELVNGPTITVDDAIAPDGSLMDLITFAPTGSESSIREQVLFTLFNNDVSSSVSCFLDGNGTDQVRIFFRDKNLGAENFFVTPSIDIQRFERVASNSSGSKAPLFGLREWDNGASFHSWGWQVEPNVDFASSPIRTSGSIGTRASERLSIPYVNVPNEIRYGKSSIEFWFIHSGTQNNSVGTQYYIYDVDGFNNQYIQIKSSGNEWKLSFGNSAGTQNLNLSEKLSADPFDIWRPNDHLKLTFDHQTGEVIFQNLTWGTIQTATLTNLAGGSFSGDLIVGADKNNAKHLFGVLGRPTKD